MNSTSETSLRRIRQLLNRELRNKFVVDQIRFGLRNQLRSIRDARGLTQAGLAALIGTKQSVISRIERDPVRVGLPVFIDIAAKLDIAFVARFESIDTVAEWYDSPSVKKMTPRNSDDVLKDRAREILAPRTLTTDDEAYITANPLASEGTPITPSLRASDADIQATGFYKRFSKSRLVYDNIPIIPLKDVDVIEQGDEWDASPTQFEPIGPTRRITHLLEEINA